MADLSDITGAMVTVLDALTWVDSAADDTFQPGVTVASCCALVVPFGQEATSEPIGLTGATHRVIHRIPVEFWVKHTSGAQATTMEIARDAGTLAMVALLKSDGTGYSLARDVGFEERIEPAFVQHGNANWLIATLVVPIENEVAI